MALLRPYSIGVYPASDAQDGVVDGAADGQQVTVAYWVDSPVAGLRVLDPNGLSSDTPAGVVASLQAAGVPEADASVFFGGLPSERVIQAGALLLMVSTLVVIVGPRPRRGTRWFWFWVVGGPLSLGVPIFAVAELLRPRYELEGTVHPPVSPVGGAGWPGSPSASSCPSWARAPSWRSTRRRRSGSSAADRPATPDFRDAARPP